MILKKNPIRHQYFGGLSCSNGRIEFVGLDSERVSKYPKGEEEVEQVIEAAGKCIVPGLVDAHTHPVWVGDRVHEFAMKVKFYHFDQVNLYHLVRIFQLLCTFLTLLHVVSSR